MTWLSMIIALIKTNSSELSGNAWWYQFFTNLVGVEKFFMTVGWIIFGVAVLVIIYFAVRWGFQEVFGNGCFITMILVWLVTLPLFEWVTWLLAKGLLANFDPVTGITNTGAFILNLVVIFLLGAG